MSDGAKAIPSPKTKLSNCLSPPLERLLTKNRWNFTVQMSAGAQSGNGCLLAMPNVSVAETKAHLSEYIARSAYGGERVIITRRDRPVAALVSLDDLRHRAGGT